MTMPYVAYSPAVERFIGDAYRLGFVITFHWASWLPEAERLQLEGGSLEKASLLNLAKLLTVHIRQDRFVEGHLPRLSNRVGSRQRMRSMDTGAPG